MEGASGRRPARRGGLSAPEDLIDRWAAREPLRTCEFSIASMRREMPLEPTLERPGADGKHLLCDVVVEGRRRKLHEPRTRGRRVVLAEGAPDVFDVQESRRRNQSGRR